MAEIAGLVLSVCPSLICILEELAVIKRPLISTRANEKLQQELLLQCHILQNTITQLLRAATNRNELEIEELLVHSWAKTDLALKLREYLGESYSSFIISLSSILDDIEAAKKSFGIVGEAQSRTATDPITREAGVPEWRALRRAVHTGFLKDKNNDLAAILYNISISREKTLIVRDIASTYAEIATYDLVEADAVEADATSLLSERTEIENEEPALSFLSIWLTTAENTREDISADALLDTGATRCCISEELALRLQTSTIAAEEEELWTAAGQETMVHSGRTKLRIRWKDQSGKLSATRMWFYVVQSLCVPAILSHHFLVNHPEVWSVAESGSTVLERVSVIGFSRRDKNKKQDDAQFLRERVEENKKKDQESANKQFEEIRRRLDLCSGAATTDSRSGTTQSTGNQPITSGRS